MTSSPLQSVNAAPPNVAATFLTRHTVQITLGDTDVTVEREHGKQIFRPEVVQLAFARHDGTRGGWVVQKAAISGTGIKRDGSLGRTPAHRDFAEDMSQAPWWLNVLIEKHLPRDMSPAVAA